MDDRDRLSAGSDSRSRPTSRHTGYGALLSGGVEGGRIDEALALLDEAAAIAAAPTPPAG